MECEGPVKEEVGAVDPGLVGSLALGGTVPPLSARP